MVESKPRQSGAIGCAVVIMPGLSAYLVQELYGATVPRNQCQGDVSRIVLSFIPAPQYCGRYDVMLSTY